MGNTALHNAIEQNKDEIIEIILDAKEVDSSVRNAKGFNVFHYAALLQNEW